MADLSPKQLRILKVLRAVDGWATRTQMEEHAGRKGFSLALGAPTREIRSGSLEHLGYVERRDMTIPFDYRLTESGDQALTEYEREHGEVELMSSRPSSSEIDLWVQPHAHECLKAEGAQ